MSTSPAKYRQLLAKAAKDLHWAAGCLDTYCDVIAEDGDGSTTPELYTSAADQMNNLVEEIKTALIPPLAPRRLTLRERISGYAYVG